MKCMKLQCLIKTSTVSLSCLFCVLNTAERLRRANITCLTPISTKYTDNLP